MFTTCGKLEIHNERTKMCIIIPAIGMGAYTVLYTNVINTYQTQTTLPMTSS